MSQPQQVYVIGHRNPDTDSICSAIAYAELRRLQGLAGVRPARAGTLNRQTEFVLETLRQPAPELLTDVHPRVRDIVTEPVITISGDAPLAEALKLYHRHNIRMLPVVDAQRKARGLLLLKKASELFLLPDRDEKLRQVRVTINAIAQCLKATAQHLVDADRFEELSLYVGARDASTFQHWISEVDAGQAILITGNRSDIQQMAVAAGVRLLIVSGGAEVGAELVALAATKGVSILTSSFDTANCSWLTRLATPVASLVGDDFLTVRGGDLLDDLRLKLVHGNQAGAIVLDDHDRVCGVATKSHLIKNSPIKLILVDHNELSQAVAGADKVEIIEVVDHHRLGNFHTDTPIHFINQPLGSTCTLVARLYRQAGIDPQPGIAGLLLSGLLSDTVILKSPTTTEIDREFAPWLARLAGLNLEEYGARLFAAGSSLAGGESARQLILGDFKEYQAGGQTLGLGQIEVVNLHSFHQRREELQDALLALREEKGYALAALLVTDIVMETSLLLTAGPAELPYLIGYPQEGENLYRLKGVLSRKKQLVPHLLKVFKGVA
jgi:manganese-dependent inorganic pyrophosphatase